MPYSGFSIMPLRKVDKNCHYLVPMPSPLGHAVGGVAAGLLANAASRYPALPPSVVLACAAAAVAPDFDILAGSHRTYTHSIGSVVIIGLAVWLVVRRRVHRPLAAAMSIAAAYASHLFLDWLGLDSALPSGLTILWPFSDEFYMSGLGIFGHVSRRYWLFDEFILGNLKAVAWEMVVLVPVLLVAWTVWSKRTLVHGQWSRVHGRSMVTIDRED
jgi:membrane-bound metal-dependent hydrolase YbcI (DUF457 family)